MSKLMKEPVKTFSIGYEDLPFFDETRYAREVARFNRTEHYEFKGYLSTRQASAVEQLTAEYPQRWHVEEFFKFHQALGWQRAGTLNLHIPASDLEGKLRSSDTQRLVLEVTVQDLGEFPVSSRGE